MSSNSWAAAIVVGVLLVIAIMGLSLKLALTRRKHSVLQQDIEALKVQEEHRVASYWKQQQEIGEQNKLQQKPLPSIANQELPKWQEVSRFCRDPAPAYQEPEYEWRPLSFEASFARNLAYSPPLTTPTTPSLTIPPTPTTPVPPSPAYLSRKMQNASQGSHKETHSSIDSDTTLVNGAVSPPSAAIPKVEKNPYFNNVVFPLDLNTARERAQKMKTGNERGLRPSDAELSGGRNHNGLQHLTIPSSSSIPRDIPTRTPISPVSASGSSLSRCGGRRVPSKRRSQLPSPLTPRALEQELFTVIREPQRQSDDEEDEHDEDDRDSDSDASTLQFLTELPVLDLPDSGRPFTVSIITDPTRSRKSRVSLASSIRSKKSIRRAAAAKDNVPDMPKLNVSRQTSLSRKVSNQSIFVPLVFDDGSDDWPEGDREAFLSTTHKKWSSVPLFNLPEESPEPEPEPIPKPRTSIHNAQHSLNHVASFTFPDKPPPVHPPRYSISSLRTKKALPPVPPPLRSEPSKPTKASRPRQEYRCYPSLEPTRKASPQALRPQVKPNSRR